MNNRVKLAKLMKDSINLKQLVVKKCEQKRPLGGAKQTFILEI